MTAPEWWTETDDPLGRYWLATGRAQAAEREATRLTDLRARAVAEMRVDGWSYGRIAKAIGVSRNRAVQLAERGMRVVPDDCGP